jgi:hypothetical protein
MNNPTHLVKAALNVWWVDVIIILIFLAIGLALLARGGRALILRRKSASWPTVRGTVLAAQIHENRDGDGSTYQAHLSYEYRVGGRTYRGGRLEWAGGAADGLLARHQRIVAAYPPGQAVTVCYDPADPSRSALEPRRMREALILLAIGAGLTAFALAFMLARLV